VARRACSLALTRGGEPALTGDKHDERSQRVIARVDLAPPARIVAANLTRGAGGVGGQFSDADWVRAIRHGVGLDGKPLLFMPSQVFAALSDPDLADIIAYVKSVPRVARPLPASAVAGIQAGANGYILKDTDEGCDSTDNRFTTRAVPAHTNQHGHRPWAVYTA
jgi:hypothetical protein